MCEIGHDAIELYLIFLLYDVILIFSCVITFYLSCFIIISLNIIILFCFVFLHHFILSISLPYSIPLFIHFTLSFLSIPLSNRQGRGDGRFCKICTAENTECEVSGFLRAAFQRVSFGDERLSR
jgi:hypothetical protein